MTWDSFRIPFIAIYSPFVKVLGSEVERFRGSEFRVQEK
jgi:hypothetical protein